MIFINIKGRIAYVNEKYVKTMGYTKKELYSPDFSFFELIVPEHRSYIKENFQKHMRGEKEAPPNEYAIITKKGKRIETIITTKLINYNGEASILGIVTDITERKIIEKALIESERKFRLIFENSPLGITHFDKNGVVLDCNETIAEMLGSSRRKIIGFDMKKGFKNKGQKAALKKALSGEIGIYEGEYKSVTGTKTISIKTVYGPLFSKDAALVGGIAITEDITESKKSEESLLESNKRFRNLFEDSPISLWVEDLSEIKKYIDSLINNGVRNIGSYFKDNPDEVFHCASMIKVIDVNKATLKLYGAKSKEELIENMDKTFTERSLDALMNGLIAIADGKTDLESEAITQRITGEKLYNTIKWSVVPGFEETLSRVLVSIIDITSQKITEEMLRQREQMYRMLVESTSALAWEFDLATMKFTYVSPQAEFITGYPPREWTDFDFWANMIIPEDRDWASNYCKSEIQKGKDHDLEYRINTADGRIIWLRDIITVIKENDNPVKLVGFMFDVSKRKNMENEVRKGKNLESLGILAGGIAHDFNNLLTSILGNVSLAKTYAAPGGKISKRLATAENASIRAKDLTRQLLTFSKGGAPVKKVALISPVIEDSSSFALSGSNVKCEYSLPDDLWPVEIDKGQIGQVINNLVLNAREAMMKGGTITISGKNTIMTRDTDLSQNAGNYVQISVADEGAGISEENISKVFDPYFTTKKMGVQKGMGLGLAICHSIVKNHEGLITVESEVGKGTTFHIYLPALKS